MKDIAIFTKSKKIKNDKFWRALGLDELFAFAHTDASKYIVDKMSKNATLKYVRNHFTLSACYRYGLRCGGEVYSEDEFGNPQYDFEWINSVFRTFVDKGIKLIVEMDFVPDELLIEEKIIQEGTGHIETKRFLPKDWDKWRNLLVAFTKNLQDNFGVEETRTWYFEVWNEPDSWPIDSWQDFYKLYDVFVDAITSVDDQLKVGGPGCFKNNFMHPFLNHITNEKNFVTQKKGTRCDFISYHIYGMSGGWLDEWPLIMPTVQRFTQELMWLQRTIDAYPSLKNTEIQINEWGVVSNYERNVSDYPILDIRNSEYSALFMAKLVDSIFELKAKYNLKLNILLYWGFCGEDHFNNIFNGNRSITTAHHILKPIGTMFDILSLLSENIVHTKGLKPGGDSGCLAAANEHSVEALVYKFTEYDVEGKGESESFSLRFKDLEDGRYYVQYYLMDKINNNSFRLWENMGRKKNLTDFEKERIKNMGELTVSYSDVVNVKNSEAQIELILNAQSLVLVRLIKQMNET